MIPTHTPRSLMRSFQNSSYDERLSNNNKNVNAKDSMKGFIQAPSPGVVDSRHQKIVSSPHLQKFNAYVEDQVLRFAPSTPSNAVQSCPSIMHKTREVPSLPPIYSASSAPPTNPPSFPMTALSPTPTSQVLTDLSGIPGPTIFTPALPSNKVPQNTPATEMKSVMMTPPSSSQQAQFHSFQPPFSTGSHNTSQSNPATPAKNRHSISINEDSTYKPISPTSTQKSFSDDPSFDKLLLSPALKDMQVRIVDQVLQLQSPADNSTHEDQASRSLFDLSPTPVRQSRESISNSLEFSPDLTHSTPAEENITLAKDTSTNTDPPTIGTTSNSSPITSIPIQSTSAHMMSTPAKSTPTMSSAPASHLQPMVLQSSPNSNLRPKINKQLSDREKNLEKSNRASPRYSPATPATPSKMRRDVAGRRLVNISRIDSIQVKGTPKFAMIDYCLLFFNLIVFFAILISLAILCQVMSAVHQSSFEEMMWWTVTQITNVQLGDLFFAFGQKYFPFL